MSKKFLFLFLLFTAFTLNAAVKYSPFIDKQLELVQEMDDANLTQKKVLSIVSLQKKMYEQQLNILMANKDDYLQNIKDYQAEIFSLKKIITINKRAGNSYAVLRDEVQVKSYEIVQNQHLLIKGALLALELPNIDLYETQLNKLVVQEQNSLTRLNEVDYHKYLDLNSTGSIVIKKLQDNIRDFYNLEEINSDFISYMYKFKTKMYRLNKYSKYHIIKLVIYLQSFESVRELDTLLESFGLSIIKILLILTMTLMIYLFRKIVYVFIQKSFSKFEFLAKYSDVILEKLKKAIESLVIIININIILYIYNDFSSGEVVSRIFNIIYGLYFTVIIYIFINAVAAIKINSFNRSSKQIKNELINVGMKIINFIIIIIGLLIALYLAGVDLTTVLSGLGIGGLAVAFAAKDTISNFFGTL
ncbi:mechanosensitive ion channel family protein, partial [Sulfurimonas sp.]